MPENQAPLNASPEPSAGRLPKTCAKPVKPVTNEKPNTPPPPSPGRGGAADGRGAWRIGGEWGLMKGNYEQVIHYS